MLWDGPHFFRAYEAEVSTKTERETTHREGEAESSLKVFIYAVPLSFILISNNLETRTVKSLQR
jgi:hypothetical protein